ncbi:MAG: maleylacetoacetate isomerase [Steroidobacteraceae bacterium]|jgi:maleylacetoacetate isomerase
MLTLYSYWRSSASYRVRIGLKLKGCAYSYQPVHLVREGGAQYSESYRELNPESRVPTLVSGPLHLTQSMAILEWLEETYPSPPLLPKDAAGRARVRGLALLMVADVQPLQNIGVLRYLKDALKVDAEGVRQWPQHWIGRGMAAFEAHLAAAPTARYCHGEQLSLADVCLVPQCYAARRNGIEISTYPNIARIEAQLQQLQPFIDAAPDNQPDAEH